MTTIASQSVVIFFGIWLIAVSILMFASPRTALRYLSKMASTNFINYLEISLRMIAGLALVAYSDSSKFPAIFNIFGLFVVITSAILFLVPRKWHALYSVWWSNKLKPPFVRFASAFSLAAGVFFIYAAV